MELEIHRVGILQVGIDDGEDQPPATCCHILFRNRQYFLSIEWISDSQPQDFSTAVDNPERDHRMRNALPIDSRNLPGKQDAESPTDDRLAFPIQVIGESESWAQVDPSIVLDRIIER